MTPAEHREQLRLSLLRILDSNETRFGLAAPLLLQMVRSEGRPALTQDDLNRELEYLADPGKSLISEVLKVLSPENRAFRITAAGRDFLAQQYN